MLEDMIADFVRRSKCRYSAEQVKQALEENLSIITNEGFICFSIAYNECHVLFCYVRPGSDLRPFQWAVEQYAKDHGCKVVKWLTRRERAFRKAVKNPRHPLHGYRPSARMFEKYLDGG